MGANKIVFILASDDNTNNIKRIEEFLDNGYDVEVYSFKRRETLNKSEKSKIEIIGNFSNDMPYFRRIALMIKGIQYVLKKTKGSNCVYYLVRNDVAILYSLICRRPYIFEEADMTHLTIGNTLVQRVLENKIKRIIKKSVLSIFRSEGFVKYHFGNSIPTNVFVIPNRLHKDVQNLTVCPPRDIDINHIKFGFVGGIRYESILMFVKTLMDNFKQHEFHFYGDFVSPKTEVKFQCLNSYPNCFFHGRFKSPDDLPLIYSQIDVLLSTYDVDNVNVRYAEPNKVYEAIYFNCPIIVSSNTFIAEKVKRLDIGFDLDARDQEAIINFISNLSPVVLNQKRLNIQKIEKESVININSDLFIALDFLLRSNGTV